jgi:hypothetical protein
VGPAVWRDVEKALLHSGRGSLLGPDTSRRTRWWELVLPCGHREERHVVYRKADPPLPKGTRRTSDDVLPAPKRVRCAACTREAFKEILSS